MNSDLPSPSRLKTPQLFILGMHRSGTSAMAGLLDRMGAYFGPEDLKMPVRDCNARGFHERLDVVDLNDRILASTGADWLKPHRFDADLINPFRHQALNETIRTTVGELDHHQPWYLKDPRLCLTFDMWRSALTSPFAVVTIRNPLEIARSLQNRGDCDLPVGLALWETYTRRLLAQLSGIPFFTVSYSTLLEQPEQVAADLQRALTGSGFAPLPNLENTSDWIDPSLRHQTVEEVDLADIITPTQLRLYHALLDGSAFTSTDHHTASTWAIDLLENFDRMTRTRQAQGWRLAQDRSDALRQLDDLGPHLHQLAEFISKNIANGEEALAGIDTILHSWRWKAGSWIAEKLIPASSNAATRPQPDRAREKLCESYALNHQLSKLTEELTAQTQRSIPHSRRIDPASSLPRVCAILLVHDESHFVGPCLDHMTSYGLDIYVLGHRCPPDVLGEIERRRGKGVVGFELNKIDDVFHYGKAIQRVQDLATDPAYDWYLRCDIDEFRYPQRPGETFPEFVGRVDAEGFNAVNFNEFVFIPTREQPDHDHPRFRETMTRYYPFLPQPQFRRQLWKRQARPVDLCTYAGHRVEFPGLRVYPHCPPLHHYLYLSQAHFRRKYDQRMHPEDEIQRGWHGWRNNPKAIDIQLPSQDELRTCDLGDPWALDFTQPRTQPYIKPTESPPQP